MPAGTEVMGNSWVAAAHDTGFYGFDAAVFRPERWLEDQDRAKAMDAASFAFGLGPRVCLPR